ncbi:MAG: hypothetical protein K9M99_07715 [Candidatus Cloacimonetes bacterium]|nr:hypothetical protein [Candidatus Cloacimonadota bacterium]
MKKWLISSIVIILLLTGCSLPENPGMPSWDTKLSLYILNDNYNLLELATEDSSIVVTEAASGDTVLGIYQEETSSQELSMGVTEPTTETEYMEIGEIDLQDMDAVDGVITFGEFSESAGLTIPGQGETVPEIAPFIFEDVSQAMDTVSEIQWVEISHGGFDLVITNNMIIGLGDYLNEEYLTFSLVYMNNEGELENVIPDIELTDRNLESGESYSIAVDLAGEVLYRDMQFLISGGSLGTNGASAVIELYDELVTSIDFWDDMTATNAEARIAEQSILDTVTIAFDDNYLIYTAEVAEENDSQMMLHIENSIDVDLALHIEIPDLYFGNDEQYSNDFEIPRSSNGGLFDFVLPLGGSQFGNGTALLETINIYATATIDSTGEDDFRLINASDSYYVESELSALEFSYIRGVIQPQEQDIIVEAIDLEVDFPEIEEGAQFMFVGESEIRIDVNTGNSQIPGELVIEATAYNQADEMVQLVNIDSGEIPHIEIPAAPSFSIVFSSDEYNINDLLSILPVRIEFEVLVTAGDGVSEVIFQQGDMLMADIVLESTLALAADAWVIPMRDGELMIQEEEIALDTSEYDAFQSATLKLEYTNTTGVGVYADILLSNSEANVRDELYNFDSTNLEKVDVISVPALEETLEGETKELIIEINQSDIDYFLGNYTYVGSRLHLLSGENSGLSGEVQLIGQAEIVIRVSSDLIGGGEE